MSKLSNKISVLMSVYKNESSEYLLKSVESVVNQTRQPDEILIVEDGPLTDDLYKALDRLENVFPSLIKRLPLEVNQGLGLALKHGVEHCSYELIARMDTDDIAVENRFELQENAFREDSTLDIIGGFIDEFVDDSSSPISTRKVPLNHEDILKYQRMRSAFNHMTVMFKKTAVLKANNYEHGLYMEDDLLWHNMISSGAKMKNLDVVLCHVRVGEGMYNRRGGLKYLIHYSDARKKMLRRSQISLSEYIISMMVQCVVAIIPTKARQFVFVKLLRSNEV